MQSVRIRTVAQRALGALLASAIALAATTQVAVAAETQDKAQLQQQLDAARGRLDDAARDVADLSRKLYGDDMQACPCRLPADRRAAPCSASTSAAVPTSRKASK